MLFQPAPLAAGVGVPQVDVGATVSHRWSTQTNPGFGLVRFCLPRRDDVAAIEQIVSPVGRYDGRAAGGHGAADGGAVRVDRNRGAGDGGVEDSADHELELLGRRAVVEVGDIVGAGYAGVAARSQRGPCRRRLTAKLAKDCNSAWLRNAAAWPPKPVGVTRALAAATAAARVVATIVKYARRTVCPAGTVRL